MQVLNFKDLNNINFPKTAVALGSFEALHAGHLNIIENTVKCAKENNIKSIITIFREPVLKNRITVCETFRERLEIIESTGADYVVVFDFNDEFKKLEYFEFFYTVYTFVNCYRVIMEYRNVTLYYNLIVTFF